MIIYTHHIHFEFLFLLLINFNAPFSFNCFYRINLRLCGCIINIMFSVLITADLICNVIHINDKNITWFFCIYMNTILIFSITRCNPTIWNRSFTQFTFIFIWIDWFIKLDWCRILELFQTKKKFDMQLFTTIYN